jgi:DNA-binding transcriptional LysR family regulator
MELKWLRAFTVLAETLHFGRAAERLCIVQPALSMQIKALEEELGVQLFLRDRHKVELSAEGRIFLPEALATLDQAQRAVERVKLAGRGEIGLIRIGFVSSLLPQYLPRLVHRLHRLYPRIKLELKDMPSPDQIAALKENRIDFGFIRLPYEDKVVERQTVLEESFVVALPATHPLTALPSITPRDLIGHPCYVLARRFAPGFYDELLLALKGGGLSLEINQEMGEFTTMIALIDAGMGIGLLPRLAMPAKPANVEVRDLCIDHRSCVGMAWTKLDTAIKRTFMTAATE